MNYTVIMTNDCNMNCLYCYEKNKKKQSISYSTLDATVTFVKDTMSSKNKLVIHGGEPLLEFDKIKYFVDEINKIKKECKFELFITTNATLVDDASADFLKKHFDKISISIDGISESHDKNRIFKKGSGTYNVILEKINLYFKDSLETLIARMTVNERNVYELSQNVLHLIKLGFKKIYPVVDQMGNWNDESLIVLRDEFLKVLNSAEIEVEDFDLGFVKDAIYKCKNAHCKGGLTTFTVDTDGNLYPCVVANGIKRFCIGDVFNGLDINKRDTILDNNNHKNTYCIGCVRYDYCEGTRCKIINKIQTDDWNIPSINICEIENLKVELAQRFL